MAVWRPEDIRYERGHVPVLLGHEDRCPREGIPRDRTAWMYEQVVEARIFDVCFDVWGPVCCHYPDRSASATASEVEHWCGLRLVDADDVSGLMRDAREAGARIENPWAWYEALPACFRTSRKTFYLLADVLRIEAVRRSHRCYECKAPFARWSDAARVAKVRCGDDDWRSLAVSFCSAACDEAHTARCVREDAERRARVEWQSLREAKRLLKETQRIATDPAYRRAARAAEKRRRADEERRKVVPMTKEV